MVAMGQLKSIVLDCGTFGTFFDHSFDFVSANPAIFASTSSANDILKHRRLLYCLLNAKRVDTRAHTYYHWQLRKICSRITLTWSSRSDSNRLKPHYECGLHQQSFKSVVWGRMGSNHRPAFVVHASIPTNQRIRRHWLCQLSYIPKY